MKRARYDEACVPEHPYPLKGRKVHGDSGIASVALSGTINGQAVFFRIIEYLILYVCGKIFRIVEQDIVLVRQSDFLHREVYEESRVKHL